MASVDIHVHPLASIKWDRISALCGPLVNARPAADHDNGQPPAEPYGLQITDPDGEIHLYVLDEEGKQGLLRQMTSGVIVP